MKLKMILCTCKSPPGDTMYAVVVFTESDEVELVPTTWLAQSNQKVLWPPFHSPAAVSKAVKDHLQPELQTWQLHKIRLLCRSRK